jgi:ADP-heptose:LPS heptosyltransferase
VGSNPASRATLRQRDSAIGPSPARFEITLASPLKRLERRLRALVIRALCAAMPRADARTPPDWSARPHRVLYLRHDRIGDMIVATGLIRAIASSHPTITLDVLASPANAPVLAQDPRVRRVLRFDRARPLSWIALVRDMRRARYDAVIDCMVFAPSVTTLLLMLASGARHRIGVGGRANDAAFTIPVAPRRSVIHHIDHAAALGSAFGLDPDHTDWRPEIILGNDERERAESIWSSHTGDRRILVNVSAGKAFRRWPEERYVAAIRHLRQRQPAATILVIGSPDEDERVARIAGEGGAPHVRTGSLREALALVATSDFVFTPDTSIGHAASAFRTPAVIMFITRMAPIWGPYRMPGRALSSADKTLASLPLEPVLSALNALLDETASRDRNHLAPRRTVASSGSP